MVYSPSSAFLVPPFGTFITHFQDILGAVSSHPRDFRDQFCKFPKFSCNRGTFFQKCGENFREGQGLRPPSAPGGWVALCLPSCGRSLPSVRPPVGLASVPACGLSDSQRQGKTSALLPCPVWAYLRANGLLYYTGRENGSTGLKWASVGLLLNRLRACPVKKGRKGEKSVSLACLPPLLARPVLSCSLCVCRSLHRETVTGTKKGRPFVGRSLGVVWCFSLVSEHC